MVQSDQLCGEVEASQVSSAHQAATRRCSKKWDQQAEAVILAGCGDFVRDTSSARGLFNFWDIRARDNSPPTPEFVPVRVGRPINETSYNHNVNSQPKFSRSASRLAVDQAGVWGQDRNAQGMTANSVCILEFQQGWQPRGVRILNQQIWKYRNKFAGMTKVDATGGLELKPKTWELLRASTAGTVVPIGHDECHRVAIYGRVETRLRAFSHRK